MYFLKDWLKVHFLERQECLAILNQIERQRESLQKTGMTGFEQAELCFDQARELIATSLSEYFGDEHDVILKTMESSTFEYSDEAGPFTLDRGSEHYPLINCRYDGSVADLICLAHEFSHAVQIVASRGRFVPPVFREFCAFIGELVVLEHLKKARPDIAASYGAVWNTENQIYLVEDLKPLRQALKSGETAYHYRWNYPLARMAAINMFAASNPNQLWQYFEGANPLKDYLEHRDLKQGESTMENYLPPMPEQDKEKPAIDAYRSLGAMALLDIDYWEGPAQSKIGDYYTELLGHMQDATAFVCLSDDRKPVGYATWIEKEKDISLTRQSAPFGDHLALLKSLQSRLPVGATVGSHHQRSAREEQVAW